MGTPSRRSGVARHRPSRSDSRLLARASVSGNSVSGSAQQVLDMDRASLRTRARPTHRGSRRDRHADPPDPQAMRPMYLRRAASDVPVEAEDRGVGRAAEPRGALGHDVHDRLEIGRRAGDDPQDLRGRRLLLERLGQLAVPGLELREQPHVLDGDDRLVGEGLEQRDLLVGECPCRPSRRIDHADGLTVANHRHDEHAPDRRARPRASVAPPAATARAPHPRCSRRSRSRATRVVTVFSSSGIG